MRLVVQGESRILSAGAWGFVGMGSIRSVCFSVRVCVQVNPLHAEVSTCVFECMRMCGADVGTVCMYT